jgi:hypothetical protein
MTHPLLKKMEEAVKTKAAKLFDLSKNIWLNCPERARWFVVSQRTRTSTIKRCW